MSKKRAAVGTYLVLSYGVYPDDGAVGLYRVLRAFHPRRMIEPYNDRGSSGVEAAWSGWLGMTGFADYLVERGYLERVEYGALHIDGTMRTLTFRPARESE